jgi:hypothetical protein
MIAGYDQLEAVGHSPKPFVEIKYGSSGALAEQREVPRMDEDVPIRHVKLSVKLMRVRNAHDWWRLPGNQEDDAA